MITIKSFVFSDFQENTFVLSDETGTCIIIDPGCYLEKEKKQLQDYLEKQKLTLQEVVLTHCHLDHTFGMKFLFETYPGIALKGHQADAVFITNNSTMATMFGIQMEDLPALTNFISEGDVISFGNSKLQILHVPGHSPGSLCYYHPEQHFLIAGDVLFAGSIGRTDLPGGDMRTLIDNLRQKLYSLPDDVTVYSGHGPATTIGREKKHNPFVNDSYRE